MTFKIIPLDERAHNLSGQIFGRVVAIAPVGVNENHSVIWLCACHCGNVFTRTTGDINSSNRNSCGCIPKRATHGMRGTHEYNTWASMVQRCTNPSNPRFCDWGGRGITVCDEWKGSFSSFYAAMGDRPPGTSLDRIDNNGPYSPDNCRWSSALQQRLNSRPRGPNKASDCISHDGLCMTTLQWARHLGIGHSTLRGRLKYNWPIEQALSSVKRR